VGGVWIAMQTLFLTPFYWFSTVWFRRSRLTTMADLFVDRFQSHRVSYLYALFNIFLATLFVGLGYLAAYKVMAAMLVKAPEELTVAEALMVEEYSEFRELEARLALGELDESSRERHAALSGMAQRDEIRPFVSHVSPIPFYIFYGLVIGVYIVAGGLKAAAITDAVQGLLIIVFSLMLVPLGLAKLGGFEGLRQSVPEHMFLLFGSVQMSDYAWYTVAAITFTSLIQIFGLMHNMAISGSATDELAARVGAVSGGFTKRFMIIAWLLCGLIAFALYQDSIEDPDGAWGTMSRGLLGPGLLGLMIAGMLAANMSTVDAGAVSISALFVKNLYAPLRPGRGDAHYVLVGRVATVAVMFLGGLVAAFAEGVISLISLIITVNAFWGAVVLLTFFWRRLTERAVFHTALIWIVLIAILPFALPATGNFRQVEALTAETQQRVVLVSVGASAQDVELGRAESVGDVIERPEVISPKPVYFERVVPIDPRDPGSAREGRGRFHIEIYLLGLAGLPVESFSSASLTAARWLFDGVLPFVLLCLFSVLMRPGGREQARETGFYAKMKAPVRLDPEADAREVQRYVESPELVEGAKLLPGSAWEFGKWDRTDWLGFLGSWVMVCIVLAILYAVLNVGA
jgi:SSS family solute:Na+ symporter